MPARPTNVEFDGHKLPDTGSDCVKNPAACRASINGQERRGSIDKGRKVSNGGFRGYSLDRDQRKPGFLTVFIGPNF